MPVKVVLCIVLVRGRVGDGRGGAWVGLTFGMLSRFNVRKVAVCKFKIYSYSWCEGSSM